jgi:hypothetical protein
LGNMSRLLLEFVTEESQTGMRELQCIEMVERVILVSKKGVEIPYKDVTSIYKSIKQVNANKILQFIVSDFFFTDNTR